MKNYFLGALFLMTGLILFVFEAKSQEPDNKDAYNLYLETGINYKFFDYLPGFSLNGVVYSPNKRLSFASRNIFMFKVEKVLIDSVNYSMDFQLSTFHTLNYLDVCYKFGFQRKHPIYAGLGLGWIYNGTKENVKLNKEYGYGVLSLTFCYKVTWFYIDLRGDVPFDFYKKDANKVGPDKLCPITIGISYRFLPKDFK